MRTRTLLLTALSLIAFAANSILCRLALAGHRIDAASFTVIRLVSGAVVLGVFAVGGLREKPWPGSLASTGALFLYAAPFSFAYVRLGAGIGALVLFACVQATMIGWGLLRGERAPWAVWLGLALALGGLIGLTAPGATAPDAIGVATMSVAGVAWGIYSLRGRAALAAPLVTTAANFLGTVPLALALAWAVADSRAALLSTEGIVLAVASGALASGVGYSLWYAALLDLTATRAAILQLLVPIIALVGGVILLGESVSPRVLAAGTVILGGVAVAIAGSRKPQ
jgi:drug/metabolite transporter (DMT)-like permease